MNKIFFLKVLVGFLTLLIFLTLIGIVYGVVNYKKTPKLFSNKSNSFKKAEFVVPSSANAAPHTVFLNRADKTIAAAFECGAYVCFMLQDKDGAVRETALVAPDAATAPVFVTTNATP